MHFRLKEVKVKEKGVTSLLIATPIILNIDYTEAGSETSSSSGAKTNGT